MAETLTTLDTQNEVKEIAVTLDGSGKVSIKFKGNFSAGDIEVGYTDTNTIGGTFRVATAGTSSVAGDFVYTIGRNQRVFARATGATPSIDVKTAIVE